MKFAFCALLILFTLSIAHGQVFNLWDYISVPHAATVTYQLVPNPTTPADIEKNLRLLVPIWIRDEVTPYWTVKLAKIALLNERPHANSATNALFLATIPASETIEPELRYFAAFKREVLIDYEVAISQIVTSRYPEYSDYQLFNEKILIQGWIERIHLSLIHI